MTPDIAVRVIEALAPLQFADEALGKEAEHTLKAALEAIRQPDPTREPSVIAKAITEEAGNDARLAAYLRKRAVELKREHKDWTPEQIAEQLGSWQSTETEGLD